MSLIRVLRRLLDRFEESNEGPMPAAGTRSPPPKSCPVCQQTIWSREKSRNVYEEWTFYKSHLHTSHPEYENWNRRASWIHLVPIALIILPLVVGVGQVVSASVTPLVFELSWASALSTLVAVFATKNSGKRRFRKLWNEQHGGPVKPL